MNADRGPRLTTGRLILYMGGLVLLGFPMVYFLWTVLNDTLAGRFDGTRLLIAVPVALVFSALLALTARLVRRWDASDTS